MSSSSVITLHGVFLRIFGAGVLCMGESGIGKSELALGLVNRGHQLIADDAPQFYLLNKRVMGECPDLLQNFLQVREVGLLNIAKLFGQQAVIQGPQPLDMIVKLQKQIKLSQGITEQHDALQLFAINIPYFTVSITAYRHLEIIIEAMVRNYLCQQRGYHATEDFLQRHHAHQSMLS